MEQSQYEQRHSIVWSQPQFKKMRVSRTISRTMVELISKETQHHEHEYDLLPLLTEKVNIFYTLNNLYLFLFYSPSKELQYDVRPKVARGELPELLLEFQETTDPAFISRRSAWQTHVWTLCTPDNR